jgi:hypothetical protein
MTIRLTPFADDAGSVSIGKLTIENGTDRIALYGSLDLTRDKQGLAHAHALKALLDQVVQVLEADKTLTDAVAPPAAPKTVANPFG